MKSVSIIVSCFNNSKTACHMSMLCLDHIRKFTDLPYQLIVIDPIPKEPIRDDYQTLGLDASNTIHLKLDSDPGYTRGMNLGASKADGEVLVFIQNDVFVREGWLPDLLFYIDKGYDVVFPDQVPRTREYVLETYKRKFDDPESMKGGRDAGLLMITKEAFDKTGGWNEELGILCDRDFYDRIYKAGLSWTDTNKVLITHIMAATNRQLLDDDPKEYDKRMRKDAKILNG